MLCLASQTNLVSLLTWCSCVSTMCSLVKKHWLCQVLWSIRGSYQTIWSFPLTNVKWHSVTWPYKMTTPLLIRHFDRTRPFTEYWVVSIEHLWRLWHADRERFLLRTPGPVPLGLAYVLLVEINPFSELVVTFPDYALRISLGTFSILLYPFVFQYR